MELEVLPMTLTIWSDWVAEHPDTTVLDLGTGIYPEDAYTPESQNDSAYFGYRFQKGTIFPVPERNTDLGAKEQVFGLTFGDEAKAYPLSLFDSLSVINNTLVGREVVIFAAGDATGVRAYERGGHVFIRSPSATSQAVTLTDENGVACQVGENTLVSLDGSGETLNQVSSRDSYWFGWYAFYPHTGIFSP